MKSFIPCAHRLDSNSTILINQQNMECYSSLWNSAGLPYLHRTVVYASKTEGILNKYYLKGTAKYVKSLANVIIQWTAYILP